LNILNLAITKCWDNKIRKKNNFDRYKLLAENIANQHAGKERIVFSLKTGFEVVQAHHVCKSDGAYTTVHTLDKNYFTRNQCLKRPVNYLTLIF
jgi:two-component system LytT family response regulator